MDGAFVSLPFEVSNLPDNLFAVLYWPRKVAEV